MIKELDSTDRVALSAVMRQLAELAALFGEAEAKVDCYFGANTPLAVAEMMFREGIESFSHFHAKFMREVERLMQLRKKGGDDASATD